MFWMARKPGSTLPLNLTNIYSRPTSALPGGGAGSRRARKTGAAVSQIPAEAAATPAADVAALDRHHVNVSHVPNTGRENRRFTAGRTAGSTRTDGAELPAKIAGSHTDGAGEKKAPGTATADGAPGNQHTASPRHLPSSRPNRSAKRRGSPRKQKTAGAEAPEASSSLVTTAGTWVKVRDFH